MSAFALVTSDEEPRDLGDLARGIQWATLIVDTALPLNGRQVVRGDGAFEVEADVTEAAALAADRTALRAAAFGIVLHATTEHRYTARPAVLAALIDGRMPPVEES
jgi:hypothetical protein